MGRFGRRAGISVVVAAVVAVAAVVGLWWKPWQSVTLPQSACWGMLSKDDLKPLAGVDGTAVAQSGSTTPLSTLKAGPYPPSSLSTAECGVSWNRSGSLLGVTVYPESTEGMQTSERELGMAARSTFPGPGTVFSKGRVAVVFFHCEGVTTSYGEPYSNVQVSVVGGVTGGGASESLTNADAHIAFKLSEAIAKQVPCTNTLDFPQTVSGS